MMVRHYHFILATLILLVAIIVFRTRTYGGEIRLNDKYEFIRPIYLSGVYKSLNDRRIEKDAATAYLQAEKYAKTSWVAFQCEVRAGTIMTIVGRAPKVWYLPFLPRRYYVKLEPDVSRGLDVILELDRGLEGDLDGLNQELFRKISSVRNN